MGIDFRLIPEKVPKAVKFGSKYDEIIDEFRKADMQSARVDSKDVDAKKLAMGLRTRIRGREIPDIKVSLRGDRVYLVR